MGKIAVKSIKRYCNNISKLIQLHYVDIYLLLWLSERVDKEGRVFAGKRDRLEFIEFIEKVGGKNFIYSDNTVRNSVQKLKELELLVATGEMSRVWVNPKYFFRGNDKLRSNLIKVVDRVIEDGKQQGNKS